MQATLIYNGTAGNTADHDAHFYMRELEKAGYSPVYRITETEQDVLSVLEDAEGLLVVVGGDGSLRAVATRVVGRNLPIALIPAGTANNVGRALGLEELSIAQLADPLKVQVDIGVLRGPWGDSYFLEGAGFGLYAEALSRYRPQDGKSFLRGMKTLLEVLSGSPAPRCRLRWNGHEEDGEYLLLEAMNTPAVGPRIPLAPQADLTDGLFDLIRVDDSSRESYLTYLSSLISEELANLESVRVERLRSFEFFWTGFPIHLDAVFIETEKYRDRDGIWLEVTVLPGALEFWLPKVVTVGAAAS